MIEQIGRVLYGERWLSGLADALGNSQRTVRAWASGRDPVPPGAWRDMLALVENREGQFSVLTQEIRKRIG